MESIVWKFLYLVSSICAGFIAWVFYRTTDGRLRKIQIFFYCSLCWGLFWRALLGYGISPFSIDVSSAIIIIPLFISLCGMAWYLWETYVRK